MQAFDESPTLVEEAPVIICLDWRCPQGVRVTSRSPVAQLLLMQVIVLHRHTDLGKDVESLGSTFILWFNLTR